ncbi:MAG: acyl-CoA dehydrogenase family protein [Actinomycetota bacterium]
MALGITEEHEELRVAVRRFAETRIPPDVVREALDAADEVVPPFWDAIVEPGWLDAHVDGAGLLEQAVICEELGRACAPGPYLPTAIASGVLALAGRDRTGRIAAVALGADGLVCGGVNAELVLAAVGSDWYALDAATLGIREVASVDPTRRLARIDLPADPPAAARLDGVTTERVHALAAVLLAAEAVGIAQWCTDTAAEYAKVRVQFGRPIGQFQGVKHRCADMLARTELARAAVWDAARAADDPESAGADLAIAAGAALAFDAAFANAKDCVQTLGGIGFTWEHDAHVYLRRAMTLRAVVGEPTEWRARAARRALAGDRRPLSVELGPDADAVRAEVWAFLDEVGALDPDAQRRRIAEAGYLMPTWPTPWGRGARAVEQVVIEQEFRAAKVRRPSIVVGAWALPPLIMYGTEAQQQRWIPPTFTGEITWCQLFSEPGAGSDLAALATRATRVEGGWMVTGQKVWTSMAREADWGILLARTNPDAPKHDGISCFMLDMRSPGIDIRPLRELTGDAFFNEVFFDDVFVPDDCLVGAEHDGWRAARTTLANERVFMGGGQTLGHHLEQVLQLVTADGLDADPRVLDEVGGLVASAHALACLGFRLTLAALSGADPSGSEAAVRKLLGVLQDQKITEVGLHLAGTEGAVADGAAASWSRAFLFNRNLTIAGGTSEIQRNIIAERVLGLPRDP